MSFDNPVLADRIRESMTRNRRLLNRLEPHLGCVLCHTPLTPLAECPRCDRIGETATGLDRDLPSPTVDHAKLAGAMFERTDLARKEAAGTEAERVSRQMDVVDLIVNGASLRQVATHFKITMSTARDDYTAGLARLIDTSIDRSITLREEVTARQRSLIMANMSRAKAGDRGAAQIVQGADNLLASIWGLRSIRVERPARRHDDRLAEAVSAYLDGVSAGRK